MADTILKQLVINECSTVPASFEPNQLYLVPDEYDNSYSLINATPTIENGNAEVSLQNRSITTVTVDDTVSLLTFVFPEKIDGKARDFFVRLVIIGESIPTLSFIEANGNPVPFDIDDEGWAEIEQGVNILMFTDTRE